jgi:hypothetical protein
MEDMILGHCSTDESKSTERGGDERAFIEIFCTPRALPVKRELLYLYMISNAAFRTQLPSVLHAIDAFNRCKKYHWHLIAGHLHLLQYYDISVLLGPLLTEILIVLRVLAVGLGVTGATRCPALGCRHLVSY